MKLPKLTRSHDPLDEFMVWTIIALYSLVLFWLAF